MKRFFLLFISCWSLVGTVKGQDYGLFLMPDVWNANYLNPGFTPRQKLVISLPSVHASVVNMGVKQGRLLNYDTDEKVHYLDLPEIFSNLEGDLITKQNLRADALGFGLRVGSFFVSLSASTHLETQVEAPESLLRMLWEGTTAQLDAPLQIGPAVNGMGYHKISLGLNYPVNSQLSVGMRLSRILGVTSFKTDRSQLFFQQSSESYQTAVDVDYEVSFYGAGQLEPINRMIVGIENFADEISDDDLESQSTKGFGDINHGNNGWGLDLGAEWAATDRLTFSGSVLNLGAIRWDEGTQRARISGALTYEGVDILETDEDDFSIIPGIDTIGVLDARAEEAYTQGLAPRIYLGVNYRILPYLEASGLLHNEFASFGSFTAFTVMGRVHLGRILSVGGIYTLQENAPNNLGANLAANLGPVQLFAIGDHLGSIIRPTRLDRLNFRAGINLVFRKKEPTKSEKKLEQLAAEMFPMAEDSMMVSTPAPAPEAGPVPAPEITPEPQPVEEPEPAEPEFRAGIYHLNLNFKEKDSNARPYAIYVDIYKESPDGKRTLVRTDRYPEGNLSVRMWEDPAWHTIEVSSHNYQPLKIQFRPVSREKLKQTWFLTPK